ncbi:transmembrane protein [Legionella cherrii]|uniref:Transmembrane protein n=1 Tax=Legionella cherrii TaxID=28084 RepID=A0A0W0SCL0_9GAMM|nr:hypothetical protein [Legionella cherrii]KTC80756.1 transmembrane protein [Legionella cherrii]
MALLSKQTKKRIENFFSGLAYAPATAFTGITSFLLGSTGKDKQGEDVINRGLIGFIADGIKNTTRAIGDFLVAHKKAIAVAAWASLAVAGAAALTLFLWPAALTAVASFSIYGISIAGIAGANALAQIGVASALAFAATSTLAYVSAALGNFAKWVAGCCSKARASRHSSLLTSMHEENQENQENDGYVPPVSRAFTGLGASTPQEGKEAEVFNFKPPVRTTGTTQKPEQDEEHTHTPTRLQLTISN